MTLLSVAVKFAAYAATLLAAGSALAVWSLSELNYETRSETRRVAVLAALAAAVFSALRLPLRAWFLTGGTLREAAEPTIFGLIINSPLGTSLEIRLAGLALILFLVTDGRAAQFIAATGAAIVAASFAFRGHSLGEPRLALGVLIWLHMLAVSFWIGGFHPLHRLALADAKQAGFAAREFGRIALVTVALLAVSGIALLYLFTGDPIAALATPYGRIFTLKLLAFAALMAIAAGNKLWLTPALLKGRPQAGSRLRRAIRLEVRIVAVILAVTAVFTTVTSPERPGEPAGMQMH
ncbi:copper resistance D family protein [Algicella marina]|nr:CopD family protein [Algicella marina]